MDWLDSIEDLLENLDMHYKKKRIKQYETECKNTEGALLARQADLRFVKLNYQNFSNLTTSFSKDLHVFSSKFKITQFKRLSIELNSDLSTLKACCNEADENIKR